MVLQRTESEVRRVESEAKRFIKQCEIVKEILKLVEEKGLTLGEVEKLPDALRKAIQENNERFEKEKPFVVYKD